MSGAAFTVGRYRDQDTGRERWAVFAAPSRTWQFPARPGRGPAQALADRLNREATDPPARSLGADLDATLRELRRP